MHAGRKGIKTRGRIGLPIPEFQMSTTNAYLVADIALADYGRKEIDIAETSIVIDLNDDYITMFNMAERINFIKQNYEKHW